MAPFFLCASLLLWAFLPLCIGGSLENRLESLEKTVYTLHTTLVEKDNRISHLENQLSEVNERVSVLELLLDKEVDEQESDTTNNNAHAITEVSNQESNTEQLSGIKIKRNLELGNGRQDKMKDGPEMGMINNEVQADTGVSNQESDIESLSGKIQKRKVGFSGWRELNSKTRRLLDHSISSGQPTTTSQNIAFHAYQSSDRTYGAHETMLFDVIAIDIGNGYNNGDGIYNIPVTGVYVFSWTVVSKDHSKHGAQLLINGLVKGSTWTDSENSADFHAATGIIVAQVNQGDDVFIRTQYSIGGSVLSSNQFGRTTFTGWMLFSM